VLLTYDVVSGYAKLKSEATWNFVAGSQRNFD